MQFTTIYTKDVHSCNLPYMRGPTTKACPLRQCLKLVLFYLKQNEYILYDKMVI